VLERLFYKLALRRRRHGYHSLHGGLWTDRLDAERRLADKLAGGALTAERAELVRFWMKHGYALRPSVVPGELVDRITAELDALWSRADATYWIELDGSYSPLQPKHRELHYKLVDLHARSRAALEAALAPAIVDFLRDVFDRDVLLFQSLLFEHGSGDPVHQDSANVVVTSPLEFAAAWIALEDIRPGSGELVYYPGSHRLPEVHFSGGHRNWNRKRDSLEQRSQYLDGLHERAREAGLVLERFLPKKGDVLFWSADLAHGGGEITDPRLTRKSLVCHYCPRDIRPYYWSYKRRSRTVRELRPGASFTSAHYEL
jgi:hypothetical protein